jgi:hypothetical protein
MKYIKKFENDTDEDKFYIIYLLFDNDMLIFEVTNTKYNNNLKYKTLKQLYKYHVNYKQNKLQRDQADLGEFNYDNFSEKVVFSSKDLKECIDMLPFAAETNKYNL